MQGLEFTNRSNAIPAWRLGANQSQSQNQALGSQYENQNVHPNGDSSMQTPLKSACFILILLYTFANVRMCHSLFTPDPYI